MEPSQITSFLQKFSAGIHSEAEHQQFANWLKTAPMADVEHILDEYNSISSKKSVTDNADPVLVSRIEAALDQYELGKKKAPVTGRISVRLYFRYAAAALIVCLLGTVTYLAVKNSLTQNLAQTPPLPVKNAGAPGTNKAILTLSDGSAVMLDDAKEGIVAKQANAIIAKPANGQLVYTSTGDKPAGLVFNTLTTPRGGQFRVTLPDGSGVWLNAVSSIRYPTAFIGNERKVEITGEVYFEITHDASRPFTVNVNGIQVRVLGTHFNINAYKDEAMIKTTLLEGSVNIYKPGASVMLRPGQQAQTADHSGINVIDNADVDQAVAWKNGYFSFHRADLQFVMRQIARWYDVEISYEGKVPERQFGGKIDRGSNLLEVLKVLEESKVHFRTEEKKIIVSR